VQLSNNFIPTSVVQAAAGVADAGDDSYAATASDDDKGDE
jgi:hypothetical protein